MRRRFSSAALVLAALLLMGLVVGRWLWGPAEVSGETSFRAWWWAQRELDVAVQVGLVFAAALGIAALMPPEAGGPK